MSEKSLTGSHALSLLYKFTRDLAVAGEMDAILQTIITHVDRTFGRQVAIVLPDEADAPMVAAASPGFAPQEDEWRAAGRALRQDRPAAAAAGGEQGVPGAPPAGGGAEEETRASNGRAAPSEREADAVGLRRAGQLWLRGSLWLSMRTPRGIVGVLGLAAAGREGSAAAGYPRLTAGRLRLLEVFAGSGALAIERAQLAEHAQHVHVLEATERLQSALLHSISHDLRTPLMAITVAFSNLELPEERLDEETRRALVRTGRQEAERLNRLVGNLLDISRIEAGALKLALELCDIEEAIGAALDRLAPVPEERPASIGEVDERPVAVDIAPDLAAVPMDLALMVQALVNVLDNAVKYSLNGSQIDISARAAGEWVRIEVADDGPGIPPGEISHIFDRFYSVERPNATHGTGLGLAISKGIVEAQGGKIWAEARPGGGTIVIIALPLPRAPGEGSGGEPGGGAETEHGG